MEDEHPLYTGRAGNMGDRAGNFAVQNSDLLFSVGSRLSIRQVNYDWPAWAKHAFVIMNDIDAEELKKPSLHVEMPVWADAKDLLEKLESRLNEKLADGEVLFKVMSGDRFVKNGRRIILLFSQSTMSRRVRQMCMHLLRKKAAA